MKIQIKSIFGSLLFEGDFSSLADAVVAAIKGNANLSYANLTNADLSGANLRNANLTNANLTNANLSGANLSGANLTNANLTNANLSDANLRYADLRNADLRNANLSYADLTDANLRGAKGLHGYAQVSFKGHGECGRMLTGVIAKEGTKIKLFCGCFTGSVEDLRAYIAKGSASLRRTRTLALDTVVGLIEAQNDPVE